MDTSPRKKTKREDETDTTQIRINGEHDPIAYPIVYGCIAWYIGRKADDHNTHNWKVYVRGVDCEDISFFVEKVVFQLHSSFAKPTREVRDHPFELGESGWGEFEFGIQIHFVDPTEPPIEIRHPLKLYPKNQQPHQTTKVPVINECYEEIVFNSPSPSFRQTLLRGPRGPPPQRHPMHHLFHHFDEEQEIRRLAAAQNFVSDQLKDAYRRVEQAQALLPAPLLCANPKSTPTNDVVTSSAVPVVDATVTKNSQAIGVKAAARKSSAGRKRSQKGRRKK